MKMKKISNMVGWPLFFVFAVAFLLSIAEDYFKWFAWEPSVILTVWAIGMIGLLAGFVLNLIYEIKEDKKKK